MAGGPGEVRVVECSAGHTRRIGKFPLGWWQQRSGVGQWYPPAELCTFWSDRHEELGGESLWDLIFGPEGNTLSVCINMWGADIVALGAHDSPLAAPNYLTAYAIPAVAHYIGGLDANQWHHDFEGAAKAPYQPAGLLKAMAIDAAEELAQASAIVSMASYLTYLLTGQKGSDSGMDQSMGMRPNGVARLTRDFELREHLLSPWPRFDRHTILRVGSPAVYVRPGTHDSTDARLLAWGCGFRQVNWTGSWNGEAWNVDGTEIRPSDVTCRLGLSFEGDPAAMQKNTAMFGPTMKHLVNGVMNIDFGQAASLVLAHGEVPLLDPAEVAAFPTGGPAGVDYIKAKLREKEGADANETALACLVRSAARAALAGFAKLAEGAQEPFDEFAVVGGWANNAAYIAELRKGGAKVAVPPHAGDATDMGAIAETLRRVSRAEGDEIGIPEILAELPPLEG